MYWNPPTTPRPPALDTAAARGPPEVLAMPARSTGCWMPRSWVRGVVMGPAGAIVKRSGLRVVVRVRSWRCWGQLSRSVAGVAARGDCDKSRWTAIETDESRVRISRQDSTYYTDYGVKEYEKSS